MRPRVEEGRGRVDTRPGGHGHVRLADRIDVTTVNPDGHAHVHVLWGLDDDVADPLEVPALEGLDAKVAKEKVALAVNQVFDQRRDLLDLLGHDTGVEEDTHGIRERLGRSLLDVTGDDPGREYLVVGV